MFVKLHCERTVRLHQEICGQRDRLFHLALAWCHDRTTAEDLVQETLARALEKLHHLRDDSTLGVWMSRIMTNLLRDNHRRKPPWNFAVDIDCDDIPTSVEVTESSISRQESIALVRWAVEQLDEKQRQVIWMVDIAEMRYAEAATCLDIPVGTVMSRLSRARKSLRALLISAQEDGNTDFRKSA